MNELTDIGKELIDYADHEAQFTAQRGVLDELFPFIYVASRRMSLRAIGRWLEENKRIKISPNALSNAMRNQETFWARLVEDVAPAARRFADAHDVHPWTVLDNEDYFKHLEMKMPSVTSETNQGIERELRKVAESAGVLRNRWFSLPEEARAQCRRHFVGEFSPLEERGNNDKQAKPE